MPTYVQRELVGVSPISEPVLPAESKHDSDEAYKKDHELALDQKAIRALDNPIVEYNYHKELTETLWNPRDTIMKQINAWNYKVITGNEAMHVPYRRAS